MLTLQPTVALPGRGPGNRTASVTPDMAAQFIYTMHKLGRFYPPDKTVLENISLSFYPGAKIGVIGSNGSGKSSLLRIMAGLDDGLSRSPSSIRPRTYSATSWTAWLRCAT